MFGRLHKISDLKAFSFLIIILVILSGFTGKRIHKIHNNQTSKDVVSKLFYIERNIDKNLVVYDANLLPDHKLNPEKPVLVYWIRNSEGGMVKELSFFQRRMAYGFNIIKTAPGYLEGTIAAYDKRKVRIINNAAGKPIATMVINGKWQELHHIYLHIKDATKLIPTISYIELVGINNVNGSMQKEKIIL